MGLTECVRTEKRRDAVSQVTICCNEEAQLHSQQEVNNAMVHELLHAYDHCRAGGLDWANCDHHACSEASRLLVIS